MLFQTMSQLGDTLQGILKISSGTIQILDAQRIRGPLMDRLAGTAAFHEKVEMRGTARWLIKMLASPLGIYFEISPPLQVQSQRKLPAIQIQAMPYDLASAFFRGAVQHRLEAFLLIYGKKETQARDMAMLTAAAIQSGFQGFLFFKKKADAFGERPLLQEGGTHLETENRFESYFKIWNAERTSSSIQELGTATTVSFALRNEIFAAISESDPEKRQAFSKSLSGLKTKT